MQQDVSAGNSNSTDAQRGSLTLKGALLIGSLLSPFSDLSFSGTAHAGRPPEEQPDPPAIVQKVAENEEPILAIDAPTAVEWKTPGVEKLIASGALTEKDCAGAYSAFNPIAFAYSWGMISVQDALPDIPEERDNFLLFAKAYLADSVPVAGPELITWQRRVHAVGMLDANVLKEIGNTGQSLDVISDRAIANWIKNFENWREADAPLVTLRSQLHELYSLQRVVSSASRAALLAEFNRTESTLENISSDDIVSYIAGGIEFDRKLALEERTASLTLSAEWCERLEGQPGFRISAEGQSAVYSPPEGVHCNTTWYVERAADFFGGNYITLRSSSKAEAFISIEEDEFVTALEKQGIPAFIAEAVENERKESEGEKLLRAVHFPAEVPVTHLRVFPEKYDGTLSHTYQDAMFLALGLRRAFGDQIKTAPPLFADGPYAAIRSYMQELDRTTDGKYCIYLDLYCHGSKSELLYPQPMHARQLVDLANEFGDCTFIVSTIACFGGGVITSTEELLADDRGIRQQYFFKELTKHGISFSESLLNGNFDMDKLRAVAAEVESDFLRLQYNHREISSRLILHTQTSNRIPNTLSSVARKGEDDKVLSGTPNHRELIRILLQQPPETIGQAFHQADQKVQTYRNLDAEVFLGIYR